MSLLHALVAVSSALASGDAGGPPANPFTRPGTPPAIMREPVVAHGDEAHSDTPAASARSPAHAGTGPWREITVEVSPDAEAPVLRLPQGEAVRLVIGGLPAGPLHLHGHDITVTADAAGRATIDIDTRHAGRFPMVAHREDPLLGAREIAVLYLEITAP